jgi:hypothetical protein
VGGPSGAAGAYALKPISPVTRTARRHREDRNGPLPAEAPLRAGPGVAERVASVASGRPEGRKGEPAFYILAPVTKRYDAGETDAPEAGDKPRFRLQLCRRRC